MATSSLHHTTRLTARAARNQRGTLLEFDEWSGTNVFCVASEDCVRLGAQFHSLNFGWLSRLSPVIDSAHWEHNHFHCHHKIFWTGSSPAQNCAPPRTLSFQMHFASHFCATFPWLLALLGLWAFFPLTLFALFSAFPCRPCVIPFAALFHSEESLFKTKACPP